MPRLAASSGQTQPLTGSYRRVRCLIPPAIVCEGRPDPTSQLCGQLAKAYASLASVFHIYEMGTHPPDPLPCLAVHQG